MFIDFFAQFLIEFIRALLIDGLSEHIRGRAEKAKRNRRIQFYLRLRGGKHRQPVVRTLSTEDQETVR
jgi:6-phosphogluconolactonase/glucosamine-6-phosphate isomerase/deaminase